MTIQELTLTLAGMMAKGTPPATKIALAFGDIGADIETIFIAGDSEYIPCVYLGAPPEEEEI